MWDIDDNKPLTDILATVPGQVHPVPRAQMQNCTPFLAPNTSRRMGVPLCVHSLPCCSSCPWMLLSMPCTSMANCLLSTNQTVVAHKKCIFSCQLWAVVVREDTELHPAGCQPLIRSLCTVGSVPLLLHPGRLPHPTNKVFFFLLCPY